MSFKSIPLIGVQRNDILEILANLGAEHAALGVSWDGCERASVLFLHLMVKRSRKEIRLNSLHHLLVLLKGVRRC